MTQRLYLNDSWLTRHEARVTQVKTDGQRVLVCLDRSAFYPEGGGQPHDQGLLTAGDVAYPVIGVAASADGQVWHEVRAGEGSPLLRAGQQVRCEIDWPRRFDHMQQHTGEHILAHCVHRLLAGYTHGLHIGQADSTIDVTLPDGRTRLTQQEEQQLQDLANQLVADDLQVACRYPDDQELPTLPLRKPPSVKTDIRVCFVGEQELCACGGTHLAHTAQVGLIQILSTQPARGKLRISFLCGLRAVRHCQQCHRALSQASMLLSAPPDKVPQRVEALLAEAGELTRQLAALRQENLARTVPELIRDALPLPGGGRLVLHSLQESELPLMPLLAAELIKSRGLTALLRVPTGKRQTLLFARSQDGSLDLAKLMKDLRIKGGGRPDFARGVSEEPDILQQAKTAIEQGIH